VAHLGLWVVSQAQPKNPNGRSSRVHVAIVRLRLFPRGVVVIKVRIWLLLLLLPSVPAVCGFLKDLGVNTGISFVLWIRASTSRGSVIRSFKIFLLVLNLDFTWLSFGNACCFVSFLTAYAHAYEYKLVNITRNFLSIDSLFRGWKSNEKIEIQRRRPAKWNCCILSHLMSSMNQTKCFQVHPIMNDQLV